MARKAKSQRKPATRKQVYRDFVETVVTAVLLALILRAFVVQTFRIPSESMEDTLLKGDFLVVNKFLYGIKVPFTDVRLRGVREPERGDVIVFEYPNPDPRAPRENYVKRCIGTPGDEVELRDNVLYINGERVEEEYVKLEPVGNPQELRRIANFGPVTVPEGQLLMLGDNRNRSADSRYWGFLDMTRMQGKAIIIYWSWDAASNRLRVERLFSLIR